MLVMKFKVCLDTKSFSTKPATNDIKGISYRLPKNEIELTLDELAEAAIQGYSFTTATFGGKTKNKSNWIGPQYLFGKDFDRNTEPEYIYNKAQELGLGFGFAYTTFSDTPEYRKLRFVFYVDNPIIITSTQAEGILTALDTFFGDSDISCKNCDRVWYGGKERIFGDRPQRPITIESLIQLLELAAVVKSDKVNKARDLKVVQDKNETLRELLDQNQIDTKFIGYKLPDIIEDVDIEATLVPQLKILQSIKECGFIEPVSCYERGERLHRPQIWGLAMNLRYIKGGLNWLEKYMDRDGRYEDYHYDILSVSGYHPTRLQTFSPFESDHLAYNLLYLTGRKEYAITEDTQFLRSQSVFTVEAARHHLQNYWNQFINADDNKVYVFKTITGLGKTQLIADLIKDGKTTGYTIAFPTHDLKDEFCERANVLNAEEFAKAKRDRTLQSNVTYVNPKLPDSLPSEIRTKLSYLYSTGAEKAAERLLKGYIKLLKTTGQDTEEIDDYRVAKQAIHGCTFGNIVTTHANAFSKDRKGKHLYGHNNTIIFDEDPLTEIVNTFTVTLRDFKTLRGHTKNAELRRICDYYINHIENDPAVLRQKEEFTTVGMGEEIVSIITQTQHDKLFNSNIGQFFTSDVAFYSSHSSRWDDPQNKDHIVFVVKRTLPTNRKIGIFSATADEKIYRLLLGDRLVFIDLTSVLCQGQLVQHTKHSCSRASLNNENVLGKVVEEVNQLGHPVITFKSFQKHFDGAIEDVYLGNSSGTDKLNGQSVTIVGTPHVPYTTYILFAKALGLDVTSFFLHKPVNRRIERNGFVFPLMTFERDDLVDVQCYFIERELYQAVGRPRLINNDVEAHLFSNYPLRLYSSKDDRVMMDSRIVCVQDNNESTGL
jgi:hypothetical protein